ncbi:hypothetical protein K456DRAFT_43861 [Colletotrichum gloeosporioides 23]|nr:hypothetical protein K456DRAFT_43861 [Colletotrichum gloeosporioides 23]
MSFPASHTYVPATAPAKRGPSLRIDTSSFEYSEKAVYRKTLRIANLSLSAAIEEVSKQPLPEYDPYSHERAQFSSFALEHSGDEGQMDYLHWKMVHNCRPGSIWAMCGCENTIIEVPGEDEEPLTNEEWNRRLYDDQIPFGLPTNQPSTANINSAILTDYNGPDSQSGSLQSLQEANTGIIALDQQDLQQNCDGSPGLDQSVPSESLSPLDVSPVEPSLQMPFPSELQASSTDLSGQPASQPEPLLQMPFPSERQASSTDQPGQPAPQLNENAEEFVPNLRGGDTRNERDAEGGRLACSKSKLQVHLGLRILIIVCAIGALAMLILLIIFYVNRKLLSG